jgi:syntaxin 1B/2/3
MNGHANQQMDPNAILNECRDVMRGVEEVEGNVIYLRDLYTGMESLTTAEELKAHNKTINEAQDNSKTLYRNLVERMKRIKAKPESGYPRNEKQVGATDRRLRAVMNDLQKADAEYRTRLKDQKRREYLTIEPNATEAELEEAVEDLSDTSLFQQAVSRIPP